MSNAQNCPGAVAPACASHLLPFTVHSEHAVAHNERARNLAFTKDGASVLARATQLLLSANPTWIDIESDLSSAFQRASREDIFLTLLDSPLSVFLPIVRSLYS